MAVEIGAFPGSGDFIKKKFFPRGEAVQVPQNQTDIIQTNTVYNGFDNYTNPIDFLIEKPTSPAIKAHLKEEVFFFINKENLARGALQGAFLLAASLATPYALEELSTVDTISNDVKYGAALLFAGFGLVSGLGENEGVKEFFGIDTEKNQTT